MLLALSVLFSCDNSESPHRCTNCNTTWTVNGTTYNGTAFILDLSSSGAYLSLSSIAPGSGKEQLRIYICKPETGSFTLGKKSTSGCNENTVGSGYAYYESGPSDSNFKTYITDETHTGTLTIQQYDQNTLSATFSYTAIEADTNKIALHNGTTVTINGEFSNVSLK